MAIYLPSPKDSTVDISPSNGIQLPPQKKRIITNKLLRLYKNKQIVNLRRNIATCALCGEQCENISDEEPPITLASCNLIIKREDSNLLIPVQMIHILQKHDEPIDPKLLALLQIDNTHNIEVNKPSK
ncbi:hypothetical protein A9Q81_26645 [Gammaproteobacteria bacterium 42_54_T18]|nr:hypothetical protein A9Q81_26645 [Gammaproteobacteria bacterium 42_54_T18]